jgi:hypothetical protein
MVQLTGIKKASVWRILALAKVNALKIINREHTMNPVAVQVLGGNSKLSLLC